MDVTAYILINVSARNLERVVDALRQIDGVRSAHAITGPRDVIAHVEAHDIRSLGRLISDQIHQIEGVQHTDTCIVLY